MAGGDLRTRRAASDRTAAALVAAAFLCACAQPRGRAAEAADGIARALFETGERSVSEIVAHPDDDYRLAVETLAGPAESWHRRSTRRVGPDLWSVRYEFTGLPLRRLRTGRIEKHDGTLEIELQLLDIGAYIRHATLDSPSLPPS